MRVLVVLTNSSFFGDSPIWPGTCLAPGLAVPPAPRSCGGLKKLTPPCNMLQAEVGVAGIPVLRTWHRVEVYECQNVFPSLSPE